MVGGLTLTMQGFGQHEPLLRLDLHAYSLSGLRYRHYVQTWAKVSPGPTLPRPKRRQATYFSGHSFTVKVFIGPEGAGV